MEKNELFYGINQILQPDYQVSFRATLAKGFRFIDGDEGFYKFIGNNSSLTLTEILWEEDIADFVDALDRLPKGPQVFIGKIKAGDENYYSLFFMLSYSGKVQEGFRLIDVDMLDFPSMKEKYSNYVSNTRKFATFLSMIPDFFFEYIIKNDNFVIYRYINQQPTILLNVKFSEFIDNILSSEMFSQEDKMAIFNFYENLKDESERFDTLIPAKAIRKENVEGYYKFNCISFYEGGKKSKKIGVIERNNATSDKMKYYLTENAYDTGTGLFNKRAINDYAIDKLQVAQFNKKDLYLAVIDIDDFKNFNDTYGHMFGDKVLSKISDIIRSDITYKGTCGRFGGDEFIIVFDNIESEEELRNIIKTIRKNISFAFIEKDSSINVTTSWGISKYPDNGNKFEKLFELADKALYIAKEKGKDRFIIYADEKHADIAITDKEKRNNGFHNLVSVSEKGKIVSRLLIDLHKEGVQILDKALDTIREYFDIDGIAIYKGNNLQRIYESGKYVEPILNLTFGSNQEYLDLFDENGILSEKIFRIKNIIGEDSTLLDKQETERIIQCKTGEADKLTIVSFDFFNRAPKVGESDFAFITIIGQLLATIISETK